MNNTVQDVKRPVIVYLLLTVTILVLMTLSLWLFSDIHFNNGFFNLIPLVHSFSAFFGKAGIYSLRKLFIVVLPLLFGFGLCWRKPCGYRLVEVILWAELLKDIYNVLSQLVRFPFRVILSSKLRMLYSEGTIYELYIPIVFALCIMLIIAGWRKEKVRNYYKLSKDTAETNNITQKLKLAGLGLLIILLEYGGGRIDTGSYLYQLDDGTRDAQITYYDTFGDPEHKGPYVKYFNDFGQFHDIGHVDISKDGKKFLLASYIRRNDESGDKKIQVGIVNIFDTKTGQLLKTLEGIGHEDACEFIPDGTGILWPFFHDYSKPPRYFSVVDITTGKEYPRFKNDDNVAKDGSRIFEAINGHHKAFSPSGKYFYLYNAYDFSSGKDINTSDDGIFMNWLDDNSYVFLSEPRNKELFSIKCNTLVDGHSVITSKSKITEDIKKYLDESRALQQIIYIYGSKEDNIMAVVLDCYENGEAFYTIDVYDKDTEEKINRYKIYGEFVDAKISHGKFIICDNTDYQGKKIGRVVLAVVKENNILRKYRVPLWEYSGVKTPFYIYELGIPAKGSFIDVWTGIIDDGNALLFITRNRRVGKIQLN